MITNCNVMDVEQVERGSAKAMRVVRCSSRQQLFSVHDLFNNDAGFCILNRPGLKIQRMPFAIMASTRTRERAASLKL